MIKVRNAGVWQDVTTYKRRNAGVWEDVILGKRWANSGTPLSYMLFTSGTAGSWETLSTSTSSAAGTMTWTTDYVKATTGGSHIIATLDSGLEVQDKFYVEFDIKFTDSGSGGLPAFAFVGTDSLNVDGLFILQDDGASGYKVTFKDVSTEGTVSSANGAITLGVRTVIRIEVNLATEFVEFFINGVSSAVRDIAFMGALSTYSISQFAIGDVEESYGANKFEIYRTEYGTHTNSIGP
jgi:hypothetical protein